MQSVPVADMEVLPDTFNGRTANTPQIGNEALRSRTFRADNDKPHLAVCIASRGVGHGPSFMSAWREVQRSNVPYTLCPTFYRPIPEAQNEVTRLALRDPNVEYLWFIEDDILLPVGVLDAMLEHCKRREMIITVDYVGRGTKNSFVFKDGNGKVILTPMGCLMVHREVFDKLPNPPWNVDTVWELHGSTWHDTGRVAIAGQQDTTFSKQVIEAGFEITLVDGWQAGHLETKQHGTKTNYGMDTVICSGGLGDLQWTPPQYYRKLPKGVALGASDVADKKVLDPNERIFIRSQKGTVMDMVRSKANPYFKRKWTEISEAQYKTAIGQQDVHRQERIETQKRELEEMDKE